MQEGGEIVYKLFSYHGVIIYLSKIPIDISCACFKNLKQKPTYKPVILCIEQDEIPYKMLSKELIAPIAQLVSALDFNFERAVEGSILTSGKRLSLKNQNVIIRAVN